MERLIPTCYPRPPMPVLQEWRKQRRLRGEDGTVAKLIRTLNLQDGRRAHWVERQHRTGDAESSEELRRHPSRAGPWWPETMFQLNAA